MQQWAKLIGMTKITKTRRKSDKLWLYNTWSSTFSIWGKKTNCNCGKTIKPREEEVVDINSLPGDKITQREANKKWQLTPEPASLDTSRIVSYCKNTYLTTQKKTRDCQGPIWGSEAKMVKHWHVCFLQVKKHAETLPVQKVKDDGNATNTSSSRQENSYPCRATHCMGLCQGNGWRLSLPVGCDQREFWEQREFFTVLLQWSLSRSLTYRGIRFSQEKYH